MSDVKTIVSNGSTSGVPAAAAVASRGSHSLIVFIRVKEIMISET